MDNLFNPEFMNTSLTTITVADLVTIITKVNNATVMTRLNNIDSEIEKVKKDIENLQESETKHKTEFDKLKKSTNTKIAKLEEANKQSKETTETMAQILKNHQQTIDSVEFERRARNVIIRGVPEQNPPNEENDKYLLQEIMSKIGANRYLIPDTKRLGKVNPNNKFHRAILIQYDSKTQVEIYWSCLLYTSPSPRDLSTSRMPSSA